MQPFFILAIATGSGATSIHLTGIDWAIVALYALVIVTVGLLVTRKPKNSEAYFLAGRSLRWPMIGASLFAANISAEHFVALAGSGFAVGIAIGAWEWSAVFCLAPLILIFLPFYIRNKIYTVPEFLERRFGPSVRMTFSLFMIVLSVLAKVSISLWAASLVMMPVFGLNGGLDLFGVHFGGQTVLIWSIGSRRSSSRTRSNPQSFSLPVLSFFGRAWRPSADGMG